VSAKPNISLSLTIPVIWALSVAKGVGPVFSQGQNIPAESKWNSSWLFMSGINQMIGGIAGASAGWQI
jgi:NCS1 family nucleobase:cation symporter-1